MPIMISGRCAACKYLRRRCLPDCVFCPYFPSSDPQRYASVHKIYGASNVGKMLQQLPDHVRAEAADSLYYEARCRIQDSVHGCVAIVSQLHQQIQSAEAELVKTQAEIAALASQSRGLSIQQDEGAPETSFPHFLA